MSNEEYIWNWLYEKFGNNYGVAALMGNLFAESSLNPINANGIKKYGLTNTEYTAIADSGINSNFINDGIAYGLVQWCYHSRKKDLLNYAKQKNTSVGNLEIQLEFMYIELQKYKTVFNAITTSKSIRETSDVIMLKYERPKTQTEAAKEKRAGYGLKYYNKYANTKNNKIEIKKDLVAELYDRLRKQIEG